MTSRRWLFIVLGIAIAAAVALWLRPAHAHGDADWIRQGGFRAPANGVFCCGVADCHRIPRELVHVVRTGYAIRIDDQHQAVIEFEKTLPSDDDEFWACGPDGDLNLIRCFFAPPVGT